ncbi:hypothetical protein MKC53_23305 [[Clostridium] innocuum]|nr:hypothetical protein [[Clostridium] innocuum]
MTMYNLTEIYRGDNPGYGAGPFVIASFTSRGDRYAFGTYHEVFEDTDNLPAGRRGLKYEVIMSMKAQMESLEPQMNPSYFGINNPLAGIFSDNAKKAYRELAKAVEFMENQ